jgi:AcrR family transcriptional regulator
VIEIISHSIHNEKMSKPSQTPSNKKVRNESSPRFKTEVGAPTARQTLLRVAKHEFAQKGLSGTSIRDIARAAKMNSSQISYYFEGKEGLYRACIEDIAEGRLLIAGQILVPPSSAEEYRVRLKLFAENLFSYFIEDRDTGLIIIREYDRIHSPAEKVFKGYFGQLFDYLIAFFKTAKAQKYTSLVGDPLTLTSLYFGMLMSELRLDHIKHSLYKRTLRDTGEREKVIKQIVELMVG